MRLTRLWAFCVRDGPLAFYWSFGRYRSVFHGCLLLSLRGLTSFLYLFSKTILWLVASWNSISGSSHQPPQLPFPSILVQVSWFSSEKSIYLYTIACFYQKLAFHWILAFCWQHGQHGMRTYELFLPSSSTGRAGGACPSAFYLRLRIGSLIVF